jgi:hypothetical protein
VAATLVAKVLAAVVMVARQIVETSEEGDCPYCQSLPLSLAVTQQSQTSYSTISLENNLFRIIFGHFTTDPDVLFASLHPPPKAAAKLSWGTVQMTPALLEALLGQRETSLLRLPSLKPIKKKVHCGKIWQRGRLSDHLDAFAAL